MAFSGCSPEVTSKHKTQKWCLAKVFTPLKPIKFFCITKKQTQTVFIFVAMSSWCKNIRMSGTAHMHKHYNH